MRYTIVLTARAIRDLDVARSFLRQLAPETAEKWYVGFLESLAKLESQPELWPHAPENAQFSYELRHFFYRTKSRRANRALFTIVGNEVRILAVRRPGQPLITKKDLE